MAKLLCSVLYVYVYFQTDLSGKMWNVKIYAPIYSTCIVMNSTEMHPSQFGTLIGPKAVVT